MNTNSFFKMSGSGNDFILIDNRGSVVPEDRLKRLVVGGLQAEDVGGRRRLDSHRIFGFG
jgi:hypothetical protein